MNKTKENAFTVLDSGTAPIFALISPASGINTGNLPVTITGSNFNNSTVFLNQGSVLKQATETKGKKSSTTTLYVTFPLSGLPGGLYNLTIRNLDGVNATAENIFYLTDQAWISSSLKGSASRSPVVQGLAMPSFGSAPSTGVVPEGRSLIVGGNSALVGK